METTQDRIVRIGADVFGSVAMQDRKERALRFVEEALEVAQVAGVGQGVLIDMIHSIYAKPVGEMSQELGGAGVTLYALAESEGANLDQVIATEINRVADNKEKIRKKSLLKPDFMFSTRPIQE